MLSSSTVRVETNFSLTLTTIRYVVALCWKTDKFYSPIFTLTVLLDSAIQASSRILVLPIFVDMKECVVGCLEADLRVVVGAR